MHSFHRIITIAAVSALVHAAPAFAKLPPVSDAAKAQAAETASKAAWADKVSLYKTCLVMDRVADTYRQNARRAGKEAPAPVATTPCTDPGAYSSIVTPVTAKPLEASEAHSPTGPATSPPSTVVPSAELSKGTP